MIRNPAGGDGSGGRRLVAATFLLGTFGAAVTLFLALRWTLPPPWALPAGAIWLTLVATAFARRGWMGLLLLLTLPAGMVSAFAIAMAIRYHAGLPLFE
jgi:hypothetical protein